jgi:aminopeptidase-like protein
MFHTTFQNAIIEELSGVIAKQFIGNISRFHRIQASPGFHAAIDYVKEQIDHLPGINTNIESYVADGKTQIWQWTAPMGWRVTDGELYLTHPSKEILARFSEIPVTVVAHSQSADVKAPLVYVEEGTHDQDYKGIVVKDKIVLTTGRARDVHRQAVIKRGALGTIHFPPLERRRNYPDLVLYDGIWPTAREVDKIGFALGVSGRVGLRLKKMIETEKEVIVHAKVDAELFEGNQQVLSATIKGSDYPHEEILLIAHICHPQPGANDNASGSALLMEIARTLTTLIKQGKLPKPLRTIRFLWVPEFYGTICYLNAHPEFAHRTLSGINCDMVAEDTRLCGGTINLYRTPDSRPSFINDLLEYHLESAAKEPRLISNEGSRGLFHFMVKGFDWRSDHMMLDDSTIRVPCPMLNHWPDHYYHSSEDSVDKCDTTQLQRVGYAVIMAVLTQAYAETDDALFIVSEVHARAQKRITQTTQSIIDKATKSISDSSKGIAIARILRKGMEAIRQITNRECIALQSVQVLARIDSILQQFINYLVENLGRVRQDEIRKLRNMEELLCASIGYTPLKRLTLLKKEREAQTQIPSRNFQGPLHFTGLLRKVAPKDAEWLRAEQLKDNNFVALFLELINFMDGHRSLYDIFLALEAEFSDTANIDTVTRFAAILEDLDLIEIQKT